MNMRKTSAYMLILASALGLFHSAYLYLSDISSMNLDEASNGAINGYVMTSSGKPIANASISLLDENMGTKTNSDGYYIIESIPPGVHIVKASKNGYSTVKKRIIVHSMETCTVNFNLENGTEEKFIDAAPHSLIKNKRDFSYSIFLILSLFPFFGGIVLLIHREKIIMPLVCSVFGIASFGFYIGALLSLISVILLMRTTLGKKRKKIRVKKKKEKIIKEEDKEIEVISEEVKAMKKRAIKRKTYIKEKKEDERILCRACIDEIKVGLPYIRCRCGMTYHMRCAKGKCPSCGNILEEEE